MKMAVADVRLNIAEIRKPELDATLVAESIAQQIEKRVMFRRAMKRAVTNTMRSGALGVKVRIAGRLNGAEISRSEWTREGRIPLHTFRADIDYGTAEAQHHLRRHRHQGLGIQGRGVRPRGAGSGSRRGRGRDGRRKGCRGRAAGAACDTRAGGRLS